MTIRPSMRRRDAAAPLGDGVAAVKVAAVKACRLLCHRYGGGPERGCEPRKAVTIYDPIINHLQKHPRIWRPHVIACCCAIGTDFFSAHRSRALQPTGRALSEYTSCEWAV